MTRERGEAAGPARHELLDLFPAHRDVLEVERVEPAVACDVAGRQDERGDAELVHAVDHVLGLGEAVAEIAPHLHLHTGGRDGVVPHLEPVGRERVAEVVDGMLSAPSSRNRFSLGDTSIPVQASSAPGGTISAAMRTPNRSFSRVSTAAANASWSVGTAPADDRDDQLVATVDAHGAHEPVGLHAVDRHRQVADRLGPHVHTAQLHHVVAAPGEGSHAPQPAPARALLARVEVREVHDVVPELRAPGLVELGDADRPELAVGEGLARVRVDDLHDEGILEDVQPVVRRALDRHPLHLVEAVGVGVVHAELRFQSIGGRRCSAARGS